MMFFPRSPSYQHNTNHKGTESTTSQPSTNSSTTGRKRARDSSSIFVSAATTMNTVGGNKDDTAMSPRMYSSGSSTDEYSTLTNSNEDLMQLASVSEEDVCGVVGPALVIHHCPQVAERQHLVVPQGSIRMAPPAPSNFNRFLLPSVSRCNVIPVTSLSECSPLSHYPSATLPANASNNWGWFIDAE